MMLLIGRKVVAFPQSRAFPSDINKRHTKGT